MNLAVWLLVGVVLGWVASLVMYTDPRQGLTTNLLVGVMGALSGGWVLSPLFGSAPIQAGDFSPFGFLASIAGAAAVLTIVNVVRRVQTRGSSR